MSDGDARSSPNYRLGATYSLLTAALLAAQEPFSALAARRLTQSQFIGYTQVALAISIPFLIRRPQARRDFVQLLSLPGNWPKLAILLVIGLIGLALYDVGLSSAHPIIAAAVLNLSPFWAALVARMVSGRPFPISFGAFSACFAFAFLGAMVVAHSQISADGPLSAQDLIEDLVHGRWLFALPMPIFFALSGTLVFEWFGKYDDGAAVASNFLVSAVAIVPVVGFINRTQFVESLQPANMQAILVLVGATMASSGIGRLFYQSALSVTMDDNGFVTMFFLAMPSISALITWPLSEWLVEMRFTPSTEFVCGLVLTTAPLLVLTVLQFHGPISVRVGLRPRKGTHAGDPSDAPGPAE